MEAFEDELAAVLVCYGVVEYGVSGELVVGDDLFDEGFDAVFYAVLVFAAAEYACFLLGGLEGYGECYGGAFAAGASSAEVVVSVVGILLVGVVEKGGVFLWDNVIHCRGCLFEGDVDLWWFCLGDVLVDGLGGASFCSVGDVLVFAEGEFVFFF